MPRPQQERDREQVQQHGDEKRRRMDPARQRHPGRFGPRAHRRPIMVAGSARQCAGGCSACSAKSEMREKPEAATTPIVCITLP